MKGSTALGLGLASAVALGLGYFVFTVRHTEDIAQTPAARASEGASITTIDDRDVSYNNRTVNRTDVINYEVSTNPSFPEVGVPTEKSVSQDKPSSTPREPFAILPATKDIGQTITAAELIRESGGEVEEIDISRVTQRGSEINPIYA